MSSHTNEALAQWVKMAATVALNLICVNGVAVAQVPAPPVSASPATQFQYDAQGRPTVQSVAGQTRQRNLYDGLGRPFQNVNASGGLTGFTFNGASKLIQVTDPRGLVTSYPRDGYGQVINLVSPDTGTAASSYDAAGNTVQLIDSRGAVGAYAYDALNRLTAATFSLSAQSSRTFTWTYDQAGAAFGYGVGKLTSIGYPEYGSGGSSSTGSATFAYDAQGQLVAQRQSSAAGALSVSYQRDLAGNVVAINYPSGMRVAIVYSNGLSSSLSVAVAAGGTLSPLLTQITHRPFTDDDDLTKPAGWIWNTASSAQVHTREYDTAGRLIRYRLGSVLRDLSFDSFDRITSLTHRDAASGQTLPQFDQFFTYSALDELSTVSTSLNYWAFTYDANGNRITKTFMTRSSPASAWQTLSGSYAVSTTSNRTTTAAVPSTNIYLDASGNTSSYSSTMMFMVHGADGRMASTSMAGQTTYYSYNNLGLRTLKTLPNGSQSHFVYNERGLLLGEYDASLQAVREYIWLGSTPVAVIQGGQIMTIHTDHLGAPRVILDNQNRQRWNWLADPFGEQSPNVNPQGLGSFDLPLRNAGQYADSESGLFYNWNRYYDPALGRYLQSDPIGLNGGINTYAYVGGNPLSYIDPRGTNPLAGAIEGAEIGTAILPGWGTVIGAGLGAIGGYIIADRFGNLIFAKPPKDSSDPNGSKAPGMPGKAEGYCEPKSGPDWVRNPNGRGNGWRDASGDVWVPTGPGGEAHGGPHWDVQTPGGGYVNVYPGGARRP